MLLNYYLLMSNLKMFMNKRVIYSYSIKNSFNVLIISYLKIDNLNHIIIYYYLY